MTIRVGFGRATITPDVPVALAGFGARAFAYILRHAKHVASHTRAVPRALAAGGGLAALALASHAAFGSTLTTRLLASCSSIPSARAARTSSA